MYAKIIDDKTRSCVVGTGDNVDYYRSIGMTDMEVERGYDGAWYEKGYAPDEPEEVTLQKAKAERSDAVSKITVEVDGMVFDGDEKAQERMSRTVAIATANGMPMTTGTTWVLADNTVAQVTLRQLAQACLLAGQKQTELWTKPYENAETV